MNARERFLATAGFERLDRPMYWECAFWPETVQRWRQEGLPDLDGDPDPTVPPNCSIPLSVEKHFGWDPFFFAIPVEMRHLCPPFEEEVIEDHGGWVLRRNRDGAIEKAPKNHTSMRAIVRGSIETREDWERIKERIRPDLASRTPDYFDKWLQQCPQMTRPVRGLHCEHWLNLCELFGTQNLLCLMLDDPTWLKEMLAYLTEFFIGLAEQVLKNAVPDVAIIGGDFCYKTGPLMSPEAFGEFLVPEFRKISDVLQGYGVPVIMMHTDGDCRQLMPMFIEAGANAVHPFEVTNGQSIVEIRKEYPDVLIFGGIDKKAIAAGRDAIDRELESKLPFMLKHGGYYPYLDHAVDPEISFDNFVYYRGKLREIVERELQ
jgi:uroporphyrinogen decarboxylase